MRCGVYAPRMRKSGTLWCGDGGLPWRGDECCGSVSGVLWCRVNHGVTDDTQWCVHFGATSGSVSERPFASAAAGAAAGFLRCRVNHGATEDSEWRVHFGATNGSVSERPLASAAAGAALKQFQDCGLCDFSHGVSWQVVDNQQLLRDFVGRHTFSAPRTETFEVK